MSKSSLLSSKNDIFFFFFLGGSFGADAGAGAGAGGGPGGGPDGGGGGAGGPGGGTPLPPPCPVDGFAPRGFPEGLLPPCVLLPAGVALLLDAVGIVPAVVVGADVVASCGCNIVELTCEIVEASGALNGEV